ncbi:MAG: tetratricopeptide repeat protein [Bryobacteraceae bacterium]
MRERDRVELAQALRELGETERKLKNGTAARQHYEEAVAIYRGTGETLRLAHTVRHLGDVYYAEGRLDLAEPCFTEALDLYRNAAATSPLDLANAIRSLAVLKSGVGDAGQARPPWEEARDLYAAVGVKEGVAESSARLAGTS